MPDGGYYAIKGFIYQYDKTIEKILDSSEGEYIEIEQAQDLSSKNAIYQVKYKEASDFTNSKLKAPICKLIEESKSDKRKFIVLCYFRNKGNQIVNFKLEDLDAVIGDCKIKNKQYNFTYEQKIDFISRFDLIFTENYQEQFNKVISKISHKFSTDIEESCLIHSQIRNLIISKIIDNPPNRMHNRKLNFLEVESYVKQNKGIQFNSAYRTYLGEEKYFRFLKRRFFYRLNEQYYEKVFIIECKNNYEVYQLVDIVNIIKDKVTNFSNRGVKSSAPYILFNNVEDEKIIEIKRILYESNIGFRDGYTFKNSPFYVKHLLEKTNNNNNIYLKFINSEIELIEVIQNMESNYKIYQFYLSKPKNVATDNENVKIKINNIDDVNKILRGA